MALDTNRKELQPESDEKPKKSVMKDVLTTILYIAIVFAIAWFIITFVGQRTVVNGQSMENTLDDGDNLIIDKITYRFRDPQRFDIIVFPYQYAENTYYIKRIIGLPGETVQIDADGNIYINDKILKEGYGREKILDPGIAAQPITLGKDEYFVMGDNRNNSMDSRDPRVGIVHGKNFVGRAVFRIWPLSKFGSITPKR